MRRWRDRVSWNEGMVQVLGVDHVVIRVSDYERSKRFYDHLFTFLGFEVIGHFSDMAGWRNGTTAFWIAAGDQSTQPKRPRDGDIGLHHYALELRSRSDVDELAVFLKANNVDIVDPAGEYYEDYYAVYFMDPDGIKLEGMTFGPSHLHGARTKGPI
jgi:catechol 2,3-dioxygenase-like lactoylglutathione lyase family enzyme